MAAKFEIFTDRAKKYRFRLKASNGEIIAASEAYDTKAACVKGIQSIQKNAPTAAIVDPEEAAKEAAPVKKPGGKKDEAPDAAPKTRKPQAKKGSADGE
jgi:uncharacterized protein YegP (UPF0339 family)